MPQPVQLEDLLKIQTVLDPRISPDGSRIAFVVKRVDAKKNTYYTSLWMAYADGRPARAFTMGPHHDSDPRWSPDGSSLLFQSDRLEERSQLFVIPADGGEARCLTDLPQGAISSPAWMPDGRTALFLFQPADEHDTKAAKEQREKEHRSTPPRAIKRLIYREEGRGWRPSEEPHIWTVDVETGETKQLTTHPNGESDPRPSPDGRWIAYVANRTPDPDFDLQRTDVYVMPTDGGPERKIDAPDGPKWALCWSPDGTRLAWAGHDDPEDLWGVRNACVWTAPLEGGSAACHTASMDRPVGDMTLADVHSFGGGEAGPRWLDNETLLFLSSNEGATSLYAVSTNDNVITPQVDGRRVVLAFDHAPGGQCALAIATATAPGEVFTWSPGDKEPRKVTDLNGGWLRDRTIAEPEAFSTPSRDGQAIHGWILKPPDFDPSRKYPMILEVHGGPHSQYGWSFFHEMQWLAGQGYVVVYTNPRGSLGYGEAYARAIKGQWGDPDFDDLMAAVDHVIGLGYVDPERLGVTGGSYGGFMTGWVVGHTDRFKAAVAQRGVYNNVSMGGTSDYPMVPDAYFAGNPWACPEALRKHSPLTYVENVSTPILILHSEGDLRCPIEQAEQYYAALRRLGKEVEFVRFPPEANHGLSRGGPPDLRQDRLTLIRNWMDRYLK